MDRHSSKLSTTAFMFVVGDKDCTIIHHVQLLGKSSPENSFFLPKHCIGDGDEKGSNSAAEAFFVYIIRF